jgi:hypothetical protein
VQFELGGRDARDQHGIAEKELRLTAGQDHVHSDL